MKLIEIRQPDDFHHHFRDGESLKDLVPFAEKKFARAIAMPNLQPPVRDVHDAAEYRSRIKSCITMNTDLEPLMTIYLTDVITPEVIVHAKQSGFVFAAKLYPAGATTNSEFGVTSVGKIDHVLQTMAEVGMPLLVHGEVTHPSVDIFDRERVFIETVLQPLILRHPTLKVVLEHITTEDAVHFIRSCKNADGSPKTNIAATITAHHLLYNRSDIFCGGIRPHMYCLPILKREKHRQALLAAATSGDETFFIGTDSAPHDIQAKESGCGCAGIFTGHAAVELYAEAFDSVGKIDKLEGFASIFGQNFYGIPLNEKRVRLVKEDWTVPESYKMGSGSVRPLRAGEVIHWKMVERK